MERYPQLVINLEHARENIENIVKRCEEKGIRVTGVIKVLNGLPEVCRAYYEGGCKVLASSRIQHLRDLREKEIGEEFELLRIPMMSEIPDVIRYADISLNSDGSVLKALNEEALRQGKIHTDFERGFIRAETIAYEKFKEAGFSMAQAKEKGYLRSEGKEYVMKDGDIVNFLFNV